MFAIICCVVLLWMGREELGLIKVFAILGLLVVVVIALAAFQVNSLFFNVVVAIETAIAKLFVYFFN